MPFSSCSCNVPAVKKSEERLVSERCEGSHMDRAFLVTRKANDVYLTGTPSKFGRGAAVDAEAKRRPPARVAVRCRAVRRLIFRIG
jgi:hypothetical protein